MDPTSVMRMSGTPERVDFVHRIEYDAPMDRMKRGGDPEIV